MIRVRGSYPKPNRSISRMPKRVVVQVVVVLLAVRIERSRDLMTERPIVVLRMARN